MPWSPSRRVSVSLLGALVLAGCGGGGGPTPSSNTVETPFRFTVDWAARSRQIGAPSSALSMVVTLVRSGIGGGNLVVRQNRREDPAAYREEIVSPESVTNGTYPVDVRFFAQPDGQGAVVASATSDVTIERDGSGIGTLTVDQQIATVKTAARNVGVGDTVDLTFDARDGQNHIVSVTPGSGTWTLLGGTAATLTPDGELTAVSKGEVVVQVSVDGVQSQPTTITVTSAAAFSNDGFETPNLGENEWKKNNRDVIEITDWPGENLYGLANGVTPWGQGAHTGRQYAFLQTNSGEDPDRAQLTQSLTGLTVGRKYRVTFWYARRNGDSGGNVGTPIAAYIGNTQILTPRTPTDPNWTRVVCRDFTATATIATFRIVASAEPVGSPDSATLLDDFTIRRID